MTSSNTILERTWARVRKHYEQIQPLPLFSRGYRRILAKYLDFYIPENVLNV